MIKETMVYGDNILRIQMLDILLIFSMVYENQSLIHILPLTEILQIQL